MGGTTVGGTGVGGTAVAGTEVAGCEIGELPGVGVSAVVVVAVDSTVAATALEGDGLASGDVAAGLEPVVTETEADALGVMLGGVFAGLDLLSEPPQATSASAPMPMTTVASVFTGNLRMARL